MNKADLVDRIASACDMSKAQATKAIDTAVDSITAALKKGERVALIGFGTFGVSQRKARNGRNPQTGATIIGRTTFGHKPVGIWAAGLKVDHFITDQSLLPEARAAPHNPPMRA